MNIRYIVVYSLILIQIKAKSLDYIDRWSFQNLCDFVYDPYKKVDLTEWATSSRGKTFNPKKVEPHSLIFVRNVPKFFNTIGKRIKVPYSILTHGHYVDAFHHDYLKYLDNSNIVSWFGIHSEISHPKFHHIPIGVFQDYAVNRNRKSILSYLSGLRSIPKNKLLYLNFKSQRTKPERIMLKKRFKNKKFCIFSDDKPFRRYLLEMAQCKFTLSPKGVAIDCYRTWEALLVGSIPVVKSSGLDVIYKDLPVLIIDDWNIITEEFLNKKYTEIMSRTYSIEKLFIEYWAKYIQQHK